MSGLKVFVPVKRVVDYAVKIRIKPDKSGASCGEAVHSNLIHGYTICLRRSAQPG